MLNAILLLAGVVLTVLVARTIWFAIKEGFKHEQDSATILHLLASGREMYAYDIIQEAHPVLSRDTVYVTLMKMVSRGLLTDRLEDVVDSKFSSRRRLYRITDNGRRVLNEHCAYVPDGTTART